MGISTARAPGFWEWDQAITRQFPIREKVHLEFRAEGFNLTNSVRLGAPNSTLSGTYGQSRATSQPPAVAQASALAQAAESFSLR